MKKNKEQNLKNKRLKENKGITLIALIITIIIMLILVAVIISMAVNGGLFDYAGKAIGDTRNAINEEQQLSKIQVDGVWYDSIDDYLAKEPSEEQTESSVSITLSVSGTKVETVTVPTGFTHTEGTIDTGYVITDEVDENGNSIGNEFVWVPVDKNQKITLKLTSEKDITDLKLYDPYGDVILTVADEDIETTYNNVEIEPTVNGMYMAVATTEEGIIQKTLTVKSLYAMDTWNDWWCSDAFAQTLGYSSFENLALDAGLQSMGYQTIEVAMSAMQASNYKCYQDMANYGASVEANGGFYIARYEAGATTEDEINTTNGVPVAKEGYVPYHNITHEQALGLAESMYNSEEFTDTLLTYSAWDRTVDWIYQTNGKTLEQICNDSGTWGNYNDVGFDITTGKYSKLIGGQYTEFSVVPGIYTKPENQDVLLTTGAVDKSDSTPRNFTNNIYDLAGNVSEYILGKYTDEDDAQYIAFRGGGHLSSRYLTVCWMFYQSPNVITDCGFRAAIYLNENIKNQHE